MPLLANAKDILLDDDGDIVVTENDLQLVAGLDALLQRIEAELLLFLGEWFLDETAGIPYYQDILVKNPRFVAVRLLFREALLAIPGVLDVLSLSLSFDATVRKLSVSWRVSSALGELSGEV